MNETSRSANGGGATAASTLAGLIAAHAESTPAAVFLEDARSDRTLDYAGLRRAVDAWAALFDRLGVPAGGGVLVDLADPLSFAVVHLAAVSTGRRSIPVDPGAADTELGRLAGLLGGAHLVVSGRADAASLAGCPSATIDEADAAPDSVTGDPVDVEPEPSTEGSALLFTSGSTGTPKGVELGETQILVVARAVAEHNALAPGDRGYNPLPLFHVNAEVVGVAATLVAGATLVLDRRFRRTGFWELMAERRITWLNAVPAILAVLARSGSIEAPKGLRFIRSASAPLPDIVRDAFGHVPLVVSWGMTEAASQITATPIGDARLGTVGLPIGDEVEARDDEGEAVAAGEVGTLWVRGPGVVTHYYRGQAADRFDADGWLSSGDLGSIDADGWVTLVGRSDDVINRGGEKVYPSEVEEVLLGDDRVREAVVVAKPDEVLGQVPVAYVIPVEEQPADDAQMTLVADLRARAEGALPRFKRPVDIHVVPDVPRAPTGKVQRNRVRELAADDGVSA